MGAAVAAPPPLKTTLVEQGYDFSIHVISPPGDTHRLFVVERGGKIFLRKDGVRLKQPFLDLTEQTGKGHEYGLYSLALHPNSAVNRRLFVYYVDNKADTRVVEYRATQDLDHCDPAPVRTILAQTQAGYALHYGGFIAFGPDGFLYIGLGDGQTGHKPASPAQDKTSLLGKMLRLDVDHAAPDQPYAIPPDNPLVAETGARGEIWMLGLRNPWRWSFDRLTGDIWLGDVGEDAREEVTVVPRAKQRGANLGWPIVEGTLCYRPADGCVKDGLTLPALEYDHTQGCSVTGGFIYRGRNIPELQGTYFYGDYCGGWVRSFRLDAQGRAAEQTAWTSFAPEDNPASFGEDAQGEVYLVMASGRIYRIDRQ
ncbi:MAG TPA: PQQ-dependent sugar dehydrogenase [Patescibacteria group bacterium]|nr:PQQ-dependent sugar dehydrogenase [Patescibacteria group bacterium]